MEGFTVLSSQFFFFFYVLLFSTMKKKFLSKTQLSVTEHFHCRCGAGVACDVAVLCADSATMFVRYNQECD
jgi:hypothetical protein